MCLLNHQHFVVCIARAQAREFDYSQVVVRPRIERGLPSFLLLETGITVQGWQFDAHGKPTYMNDTVTEEF